MYKYKDLVKVKTGFYQNLRGFLESYDTSTANYTLTICKVLGIQFLEKTIEEYEGNLELVEEAK